MPGQEDTLKGLFGNAISPNPIQEHEFDIVQNHELNIVQKDRIWSPPVFLKPFWHRCPKALGSAQLIFLHPQRFWGTERGVSPWSTRR